MRVLMFAVVAAVAVAVVASQGASASSADEFLAFQQWSAKWDKNYAAEEVLERAGVFSANLRRLEELRERTQDFEGAFGWMESPFMDITHEEFKRTKLGFRPAQTREEWEARRAGAAPLVVESSLNGVPSDVDWRTKGVVTPVKDQGQCGSCWAFSAGEVTESALAMATGQLKELSIQEIVSCDKTDGGCDGGDTPTAYKFIMNEGGLDSQSAYPYTSGGGNTGRCHVKKDDFVATVSSWSYPVDPCFGDCNHQNATAMIDAIANVGPLSVCVNAAEWGYMTGRSVITPKLCGDSSYGALDHCVAVVGYHIATSENDESYLLVRNSWGTSWPSDGPAGLEGYIRLKIGTGINTCGVLDEVTSVKAALV